MKTESERLLSSCTLCPRACRVNRLAGQTGFCGMGAEAVIARAALHHWEEPCISGTNGSGTVFFSGCTLRCVFCQNHRIAAEHVGKAVSADALSAHFLDLQAQGAHNINLVTPTHFVPQILESLDIARRNGLDLPIVYNTSGYETIDTLRLLEGYVDIYLPDFKYITADAAKRYSSAADYPETARAAIREMVQQVGAAQFDADGMMRRGVLIRHLLLPDEVEAAKKIVRELYQAYGDRVYFSLMNQYTPMPQVRGTSLDRTVTEAEYDAWVDDAVAVGVENGFVQEGGTVGESFIPPFEERI
ncbi:MAG: radical SAM protein [Ruminococcus sp.]|nr:radical SAM protein [Ruminococcus sp.]